MRLYYYDDKYVIQLNKLLIAPLDRRVLPYCNVPQVENFLAIDGAQFV